MANTALVNVAHRDFGYI